MLQCVDITFVEPNDPRVAEVNESNCFNSTELGFADVYTITTRTPGLGNASTSDAEASFLYFSRQRRSSIMAYAGWLPAIFGGLWLFL